MTYAILINNQPKYWTGHITVDRRDIFTNDPTPYGYKEVVNIPAPQQEGYVAVPDGWDENETTIWQKWRLEPAPEPGPDIEQVEAQGLYTATMTDTLLEDET